jgi:type I restriction enzyme S subunit
MEKLKDGYKETELGIIPEEWEVKKFAQIFKISAGRDLIKDHFSPICDNEYCFPIYSNSLEKRGLYGYTKIARHKRNSITITGRGTLGKANPRYTDFDAIGRLLVLEPKIDLNCAFISEFINYKVKFFIESTGVPQLTVPQVSKSLIALPPLEEQNQIASILSTVDDLIENTDHLINSYTLLKKGLMQTLLTKGIGHTKFKKTEIGIIPEDWEVTSLENLGTTYNGLSGKNKEHFGKGKPFIPYKNIFNNTKIDISYLDFVMIDEDEAQNKVQYGDVFFTTSSETAEEVGYTSVLLDDLKETYLNSFCFGYRLNDFNKVRPEFLRYLLRGQSVRKSIIKIAQGYTRFNLSKLQVLKILIPIPPIMEQLKIASILSSVDDRLELYKSKKEKLNLLKKGLMQQLLTGKIRVKV